MADKLVSVNDDYDFPAPVAARQAEKVAQSLTTPGSAMNTAMLELGDTTYTRVAYGDAEAPVFVRANGGKPVFTAGTQNPAPDALAPTTSPSIYWPWIVDARKHLKAAALDEFYMYYSTDHEGIHSSSGIWLATAPTEAGPWTGRGRVFIDNTSGSQTETPSVVWNPSENQFFMYYQQYAATGAVGVQSTLLATSPDGLTWTRVGIAIDIAPSDIGDGHTGYFRPFRVGNRWYAYHLAGGGDWPTFGLSYSDDGRKWFLDPNLLGYARDLIPDNRLMQWNHCDIFQWKGRSWLAGLATNAVSGSAAKDGRIITAPVSPSLRQLTAPPTIQLHPTVNGETTNYRSTLAHIGRDGKIYFYYQCDNKFYLAIADGGTN